MHVDRLRALVQCGDHLKLDGAVEIAKAAPMILRMLEAKGEAGQMFLLDTRISEAKLSLQRLLRDLPVQNGTMAERIRNIIKEL